MGKSQNPRCATVEQCIPSNWVCDRDFHCPDRSDETDCRGMRCSEYQFRCRGTGWCVPLTWRCDGEIDCGGGLGRWQINFMEREGTYVQLKFNFYTS